MFNDVDEVLEKFFEEGKVYEVVATTLKDAGEGPVNAAAMGVTRKGENLNLRVFKGSDTFQNLRELRRVGINIVSMEEVDLLARSALMGWGSVEEEFSEEEYEGYKGFPFLKRATAHIDCGVEEWTEEYGSDDYGDYHIATFTAVPKRGRMVKEGSAIARGSEPIIESLVFSTRWKVCDDDDDLKDFLEQRVRKNLALAGEKGGEATMRAIGIVEGYLKRVREEELDEDVEDVRNRPDV